MEKEEKMKANSENLLWHGVPLRRAGEMLGVKAKTLHNRISRGDFREGEDFRKPMGRVLMSLVTVQRSVRRHSSMPAPAAGSERVN